MGQPYRKQFYIARCFVKWRIQALLPEIMLSFYHIHLGVTFLKQNGLNWMLLSFCLLFNELIMDPGHLPRRDRPCSSLKRKPSVDPRTQLLYIVTFACLHFHFPWEKLMISNICMKSKHTWPLSRLRNVSNTSRR